MWQCASFQRAKPRNANAWTMKLNLPVYLDQKVQATLAALANAKGVDFSVLINDLLKKDIELIEMAR